MLRTLAAIALLAPAAGLAHDLRVEPAPRGFALHLGHRGGEALEIAPAKVKRVRCGRAGAPPADVLAAAAFTPREVTVAARCDVVSVLLDGGFWSLTPDGEVNLPRDQARAVVRAWASRQHAKWVDASSPGAATVLGDELEIAAPPDLGARRAGDKVTLRVLSGGQPVPGAAVAIDHRLLGETNSRGEVRLKLRRPGLESISASVRRPLASPQAESVVLEASLTFEVAR
jgi:hypothetical protein